MKRALRIILEDEGRTLLRDCTAEEVGMWVKLALIAREKDRKGEVLIGEYQPVPEQIAKVCSISPKRVREIDAHLKDKGLLTPNGRIANYSKMVDDDRRKYQSAYYALQKVKGGFNKSSTVEKQLVKSKSKQGGIIGNSLNLLEFEKEYKDADFGTRFFAFHMMIWDNRQPKAAEMYSGGEFEKKYGEKALFNAMLKAAKQGHKWWAVEKNLDGSWKPRAAAGSKPGVNLRHKVDKA